MMTKTTLPSCQSTCNEDVDTTRIRLLLSNDVEQNPGPVVNCKWENCSETFTSAGPFDAHVVQHTAHDKHCRWEGCQVQKMKTSMELQKHVIRHVYDNEELCPSLEDWIISLPDGKFTDTSNLNWCPKHIRSKLQMLFFDEEFEIPSIAYSALDHGKYLEFLFSHYPTKYQQNEKLFLDKRRSIGEDWSTYIGQDIRDEKSASTSGPSASLHTARRFYSAAVKHKFSIVQITKSELSSKYFLGTELKPEKTSKRKLTDTEKHSEQINHPWFQLLLSNLRFCDRAIALQQVILNKMNETGLIDSTDQTFFFIEQAAARLAAHEDCTAGTFVCFVFKCLINNDEIFYIRYLESGCFAGFMEQKLFNILRENYQFQDNNCLVHNVYTSEDIEEMQQVAVNRNVKRSRPDKLRSYTIDNIMSVNVNKLKKFTDSVEPSDVKLQSYVLNIGPYKTEASVNCPETSYIESCQLLSNELHKKFIDFRIHRLEVPPVKSLDVFEKDFRNNDCSLLQQSKKLNCLSGNIKRQQSRHLFKRLGRYEANFLTTACKTSSLRNHVLALYLAKDFTTLYSFLVKYFPDLDNPTAQSSGTQNTKDIACVKKQKTSTVVKSVSVEKSSLRKKLKTETSSRSQNAVNNPVDLYHSYCFKLLTHGKLSIQSVDESKGVVCAMNDYSPTDGTWTFLETDFVFTSKFSKEIGNYFYCSCSTYTTMLDKRNNQTYDNSSGESSVMCLHCRFLRQQILPVLDSHGAESQSAINKFIHDALQDNRKEIVELVKRNNIRKFSVFIVDERKPTFVHVTFNRSTGNHIISCMNDRCILQKGHKKNIDTFDNGSVCKHLSILRNHLEHWHDLKNVTALDHAIGEELTEMQTDDNSVEPTSAKSSLSEETNLSNFTCISSHKSSDIGSERLKFNLIKRDGWNDSNLIRDKNGYLIGPSLFPDIPDNTKSCECGAGWLKRADVENYSQNGRTDHESSRILNIYTSIAPVKCQVHVRVCYNDSNPCRLSWDEGKLDSLHVLSRDIAAGEEIGWEFVIQVMNSGCTFSSFCKLKTREYQMRDSRVKFMDATVFLRWWFSWASNMKIDLRESCDVCCIEQKKLCCDGAFRSSHWQGLELVSSEICKQYNSYFPNIKQSARQKRNKCFRKKLDVALAGLQ